MNADDILFAPVTNSISNDLVRRVVSALDGGIDIEFTINPSTTALSIYHKLADTVQNHPYVLGYNRRLVGEDPHGSNRPAGALMMHRVFERLYQEKQEFLYCAKGSGCAFHYRFKNWFSIKDRILFLAIEKNNLSELEKYEWWALGLFNNFVGYGGFYCFEDLETAKAHYD